MAFPIPIIGDIIAEGGKLLKGVLDKVAGDKISETEKEQIAAQSMQGIMSFTLEMIKQQTAVILAEAQGGWLQRNWRPLLMLGVVAIVMNNYIIYPYLSLFGTKAMVLELPEKLWNLLTIGVGGYVVGRSAEKIAESWKKNGK